MFTSLLRCYINRKTLITLYNLFKKIRQSLTMFKSNDPQSTSTPCFDPSQPSIPISYPIKTLHDLKSGSYFDSLHYPFNKSSVPTPPKEVLPNRGRILVCHDMMGGYVDDKWVQGGYNEDAYAIWHWYLIDVFVYFSHYLVTLPPPCWTNTAHRHGVKVLGTFITEWDEGKKFCDELLETKESTHMYAERLVDLAVALGFDGWLVNMEVDLEIAQIPNLKEFVSHLTRTMHSSLPGSLVIWYDSVTINGNLKWQNQLNELNKPFFDICDGIFVNYSWQEDYPKLSAAVAGDRKFDVYMGIDVFGRNTYGGGQWNTNVALDVLKKDDVSAAIFAPGWIYETKQPPNFQTAQNRWWALVEKSWGKLHDYPQVLPFYSNFDQGHGYHISIEGEQVLTSPWNNISCQGYQPFLELTDTTSAIQVLVDFKEASYSGGGNMTFVGTLEENSYFSIRIFQGEFLLGNSPAHLTYSVKSEENSLLGLSLEFSSVHNNRKSVLLASWGMNEASNRFDEVIVPHRVKTSEKAPGWVVQESGIAVNGFTLTEIHVVCYRPKPEDSVPRLGPRSYSQDNTLAPTPSDFFAVLGHITIKASDQKKVFPPSASWLVESQYIKWIPASTDSKILNVKIIWKLKDGDYSSFWKYNIFVVKQAKQVVRKLGGMIEGTEEYVGVALVEAFYVADLVIPSGTSSLKFIVQVCGVDGSVQKLDDSPFVKLDVEGQ
ncbi:Glyco_hydro_85 domain-containing protein [Cephalotus follicularis]|uniref:mannosyl-glycoprotein endo-beta-N-acetylglucosaminidase n=1 Tax=Cephalotus follicularis TaxID=3775 RepID=A0A1Q3D8Z0_CEPFO|nr:Glyco_hydro_85 domain-containing protein [Cephalotus follicularis]